MMYRRISVLIPLLMMSLLTGCRYSAGDVAFMMVGGDLLPKLVVWNHTSQPLTLAYGADSGYQQVASIAPDHNWCGNWPMSSSKTTSNRGIIKITRGDITATYDLRHFPEKFDGVYPFQFESNGSLYLLKHDRLSTSNSLPPQPEGLPFRPVSTAK